MNRIYMLIDRSGSMSPRWNEIGSMVKAYFTDVGDKESVATVVFFDGNGFGRGECSFDVAVRNKPIGSVNVSGVLEMYRPRGNTPLFDAIGTLSSVLEQDVADKATIVIVTDGEENSSNKYSKAASTAIVDKWKKQDFNVMFVGADFENVQEQARSVGIEYKDTILTKGGKYEFAAEALGERTRMYNSGQASVTLNFSDAARSRAV